MLNLHKDGKRELLNLGQMARRLRVTTRWLRAEADEGRVPCVQAEGRVLFSPQAVVDSLIDRATPKPVNNTTNRVLLYEHEAATMCGINPGRFTRMTKKSLVPHVLLPDGEYRYEKEILLEWIKTFRVDVNSQ